MSEKRYNMVILYIKYSTEWPPKNGTLFVRLNFIRFNFMLVKEYKTKCASFLGHPIYVSTWCQLLCVTRNAALWVAYLMSSLFSCISCL